MKIDTKKIGQFLKSIDGADYGYLESCMNMRSALQNLIKRHKVSKEEICSRFEIKPTRYRDFIMGNCNYSIHDMAVINVLFVELESKALEKKAPFQVANNENDK